MRFLTKSDAVRVIDVSRERGRAGAVRFEERFRIPADAGARTSLVRQLTALFANDQPVCLHITAWGIWPSNQNMRLFETVRLGLGETRPLHEVPGHIFEPGELDSLEAVFCLIVYFLWDATLLSERGDVEVVVSHDEYVTVRCTRDIPAETARALRKVWG